VCEELPVDEQSGLSVLLSALSAFGGLDAGGGRCLPARAALLWLRDEPPGCADGAVGPGDEGLGVLHRAQPPGAAGHAGLLRWAPAWGAERLFPGARAAGGPHAAMGSAADRADRVQPAPAA